jgi:hypothetical protein
MFYALMTSSDGSIYILVVFKLPEIRIFVNKILK